MDNFDFIKSGKRTIQLEQEAVAEIKNRIDERFELACTLIFKCHGKVIVTGVGKSGHIANKIAATLASTGTPAFFVHPAEASHGDFGMVTKNDIIIAISNSGASSELVNILPMIKRLGCTLITMTGKTNSILASAADANLDISVKKEACPHNLAPTSSTTASLAMGDALAIALLEAKGFSTEDFAFSHPGGTLGKKLLLRVADIMHNGQELPLIKVNASLADALAEISDKGLGMTVVTGEGGELKGVFTDGDLRRSIESGKDIRHTPISDLMTHNPQKINCNALAAEALNIMEGHKITSLIVEDENDHIIGVLHMHDLLRAGLI